MLHVSVFPFECVHLAELSCSGTLGNHVELRVVAMHLVMLRSVSLSISNSETLIKAVSKIPCLNYPPWQKGLTSTEKISYLLRCSQQLPKEEKYANLTIIKIKSHSLFIVAHLLSLLQ